MNKQVTLFTFLEKCHHSLQFNDITVELDCHMSLFLFCMIILLCKESNFYLDWNFIYDNLLFETGVLIGNPQVVFKPF